MAVGRARHVNVPSLGATALQYCTCQSRRPCLNGKLVDLTYHALSGLSLRIFGLIWVLVCQHHMRTSYTVAAMYCTVGQRKLSQRAQLGTQDYSCRNRSHSSSQQDINFCPRTSVQWVNIYFPLHLQPLRKWSHSDPYPSDAERISYY